MKTLLSIVVCLACQITAFADDLYVSRFSYGNTWTVSTSPTKNVAPAGINILDRSTYELTFEYTDSVPSDHTLIEVNDVWLDGFDFMRVTTITTFRSPVVHVTMEVHPAVEDGNIFVVGPGWNLVAYWTSRFSASQTPIGNYVYYNVSKKDRQGH